MSDFNWRTSTYTDKYNCVEVSLTSEATTVRDSKDPYGGTLAFSN
ncbi:DUF397 domain-containing protein [Saccharopolyspora pogona]|nr:DUF397 domain-containing protein [Saccharopolyspora pogona]